MVVTRSPKGRPFGIMEDYTINGINAFLELMDKWAADCKTLLELLAKIDACPRTVRMPTLPARSSISWR